MNLFGFDISELDLANFVAAMRLVTIGVVTISFLLFFRQKRWTILAMGIAVLVVVGWLTTFYPLARIYGLQAPGDRLRNLSWVASVAAGNSPMSTGRVGDVTLEPLWALVAGGLCFGHPEFAPVVYALVSLVIPLMLGLVLFLHFRRREDEESGSELRALVVVAFALLVSSGPLDYLAPFRDFYAKNFFLKPNHTLGFVFIPLLIGGIASRRKLWLAKTAVLLSLLGWAFIVHWAFFCFGLGIYLVLHFLQQRKSSGGELRSVLILWILSAIAVAPYISIIYRQHPHAIRIDSTVVDPEVPSRSAWGDMRPVGSSLLLLVTFDRALLFFLAIVGASVWWRGGLKRDLLWLALLLSVYLLWGVNYVGYLTAQAREADEFYYFLDFVLSVAAGVGAWRLLELIASRMPRPSVSVAASTLVVILVVTPLVAPYWRNPEIMDGHFRVAREPLPGPVVELRDWVLEATKGTDVLVADGIAAFWVPALTGRQVLVPYRKDREYLDALLSSPDGQDGLPFRVTHVVYSHELEAAIGLTRQTLELEQRYKRVFENRLVTIYLIE